MTTYNETTAQSQLANLKDWKYDTNGIVKDFVFKNFNEALAFIVQVGLLAEKVNHHPEVFNVYNKVHLRLSTHDANGLTDKDFNLAKMINLLG
ncbi:4a-hydroxytetrahydrobiopterin dehydratase [Flavobacterium sp. UMI-01]|uniref:4a-hydroxytetrahydrobiopterin dehydratase n=1 Tax=Flavobacterium sp. UMI-01 TaxID=1441053 RepID=UPI001C7D743D|nr:4a-hydroxytetrahydrobiopterin dehydratase [Flavobacterium sp. UMI-01]GIZ08897.1 hypothetical protein FUMI01_16240 [Flavobacterium sp. UMI-01]